LRISKFYFDIPLATRTLGRSHFPSALPYAHIAEIIVPPSEARDANPCASANRALYLIDLTGQTQTLHVGTMAWLQHFLITHVFV
jgi:hypothetical protein